MKLIDNWKSVLRRSAALWAAYAGIIFGALDVGGAQLISLLPALKPVLDDTVYGHLSFFCLVVIPLLRVVDQGIAAAKAAAVRQEVA